MRRRKSPLSTGGGIWLAQNARGTGAFQADSLRNVGKRYLVGCACSHPRTFLQPIPCLTGKIQGFLGTYAREFVLSSRISDPQYRAGSGCSRGTCDPSPHTDRACLRCSPPRSAAKTFYCAGGGVTVVLCPPPSEV